MQQRVELESGRSFIVPKWSVKKMIDLGHVISGIVQKLFDILEANSSEDDDLENIKVGTLLSALPHLVSEASTELATVIESSLTLPGGEKQITVDQILGTDETDSKNLDLDEFPDILMAIVERNLTPKTVGKWKTLLSGGMGALTGSPKKKRTRTRKKAAG